MFSKTSFLTCLREVSIWYSRCVFSRDSKQAANNSYRIRGDVSTALGILDIAGPELTDDVKDGAGTTRSYHSRNEVECISISVVSA